jgi:hypothetical protein
MLIGLLTYPPKYRRAAVCMTHIVNAVHTKNIARTKTKDAIPLDYCAGIFSLSRL